MNRPLSSDQMIQEAGQAFRALGDPSRLRLLGHLMAARGPTSQGALAEAAGLSQANASKHLACLLQAGLVIREREGAATCSSLEDRLVPEICKLVKEHVYIRTQTSCQALR